MRKLLTGTMRAKLSADGRMITADLKGLSLALDTDTDLTYPGVNLQELWRDRFPPLSRMLLTHMTAKAYGGKSNAFTITPAEWAQLRSISSQTAGQQIKNSLEGLSCLGYFRDTPAGGRIVIPVLSARSDLGGKMVGRNRVYCIEFTVDFYELFIARSCYYFNLPPEYFALDMRLYPGAGALYLHIAESFQIQNRRECFGILRPLELKGGTALGIIGINGGDARYHPARKMRDPLEAALNHLRDCDLILWTCVRPEGRCTAQRVMDTVYRVMPQNKEFTARVERMRRIQRERIKEARLKRRAK